MKINTWEDLTGIWYRGSEREPINRTFPKVDDCELATIVKANLPDLTKTCKRIEKRLRRFSEDYTIHYSNYNEKNTWSAISLRGYQQDWRFITKPEEMSRKWKEENSDTTFRLQNTDLRKLFPEVEDLLKHLPTTIHRIRFMKLLSSKGRLNRHTDLVDKDLGTEEGRLMRFHFPIITNNKVVFSCWGEGNRGTRVKMKVGGCYCLDIRKPHSAENTGNTDRIHLVVDVVSNQTIRDLISS